MKHTATTQVILGFFLAVALSSCKGNVQDRKTKAHAHGPSTNYVSSAAMDPCGTLNIQSTFRIRIDDLNVASRISRNIKKYSGDDTGSTAANQTGDNEPGEENPFHIHLHLEKGSPKYPYAARIRVIIADNKGLKFLSTTDPSSQEPIEGIARGTVPSGVHFCVPNPYIIANPRDERDFVVEVDAANAAASGAFFNILLVPQNAKDTPVIVDPKVTNNG